jgi:DNA polymerase III subunit delta
MKIETVRIDRFLGDPGRARVVLLYGEDVGLIRERATRLVRQVAGATDDPFLVVQLERDELDAIPAEMASLALTGGRRVVRVRDATDAAVAPVEAALAARTDGLLVLEAPTLAGKSRLRTVLEKAPDAAVIACYKQDPRALGPLIRSGLAEMGVAVDPQGLAFLTGQLGADRGVTQSEIDKLGLYVGQGGTVDLAAAQACVGDLAGLSLEDAVFAATAGDVAGADRALELAMQEGATAVGVVRTALGHVQKLQRARGAMEQGASAAEAAKAIRPPLFFRREPALVQALMLWPPRDLDAAAARLWEVERLCKRTNAPDATLCRNVVLGLAQRAALARRR